MLTGKWRKTISCRVQLIETKHLSFKGALAVGRTRKAKPPSARTRPSKRTTSRECGGHSLSDECAPSFRRLSPRTAGLPSYRNREKVLYNFRPAVDEPVKGRRGGPLRATMFPRCSNANALLSQFRESPKPRDTVEAIVSLANSANAPPSRQFVESLLHIHLYGDRVPLVSEERFPLLDTWLPVGAPLMSGKRAGLSPATTTTAFCVRRHHPGFGVPSSPHRKSQCQRHTLKRAHSFAMPKAHPQTCSLLRRLWHT